MREGEKYEPAVAGLITLSAAYLFRPPWILRISWKRFPFLSIRYG